MGAKLPVTRLERKLEATSHLLDCDCRYGPVFVRLHLMSDEHGLGNHGNGALPAGLAGGQ
jgi:hypothetical protein